MRLVAATGIETEIDANVAVSIRRRLRGREALTFEDLQSGEHGGVRVLFEMSVV